MPSFFVVLSDDILMKADKIKEVERMNVLK